MSKLQMDVLRVDSSGLGGETLLSSSGNANIGAAETCPSSNASMLRPIHS
jgi:hypothetical protein